MLDPRTQTTCQLPRGFKLSLESLVSLCRVRRVCVHVTTHRRCLTSNKVLSSCRLVVLSVGQSVCQLEWEFGIIVLCPSSNVPTSNVPTANGENLFLLSVVSRDSWSRLRDSHLSQPRPRCWACQCWALHGPAANRAPDWTGSL